MDLEYYRNFITIVDSQTLTEAAKKLSMVQPALSAQLKQIERQYNANLIITHRGGRRIELTESGELFYRRAKEMIRIADDLKLEVASIEAGEAGILRVAITPGAIHGFMDDYLAPFAEKNPGFRLRFNEGNVDQQAEALLSGVADIGVVNEPIPRGYLFDLIDIRYRSLIAVAPPESKWLPGDHKELRIEDLSGVPLCVTRSIAPRLESFFRERGLHEDIRSICMTNVMALYWARKGMGVAVISGRPGEWAKGLIEMPISTEEIMGAEHIYRVKDRKLTVIAERFCRFIKDRK